MGRFSKDIETLDDLFVHSLRDIYYAENQTLKALPKMIKKAGDRQLREALSEHLNQTKTHVDRLVRVFEMHGARAGAVDCPAIDGIIEEADQVMGDVADKQVLDAAIIAAAQAVEHYEITRYGTLATWAKQLGLEDCAAVLVETLEEEKEADEILTDVAKGRVNAEAA